MNKKRPRLITIIQTLVISSVLTLSSIILIFQVISQKSNIVKQSILIQNEYNLKQKVIIKDEVTRVVELINHSINDIDKSAEQTVKNRSNEAYSVVKNIYNENLNIKSESEIKKMIVDALRPVRFNENSGSFFIFDTDGDLILFNDSSEFEGQNIKNGRFFNRNNISKETNDILKKSGEGIITPLFNKQSSYIKLFEPYNWFIGTTLDVDYLYEETEEILLDYISKIRFGTEGYIFINKYDGNVLISGGERYSGDYKLWEVATEDIENSKALFKNELAIAQKPKGDYLYYSFNKKDDLQSQFPKVSYIYGIDNINWIVGAGVYLDDVKEETNKIKDNYHNIMKKNIIYIVVITIFITIVLAIIFICITKNLKTDFILFSDFFDQKSFNNSGEIDVNLIRYQELYDLAGKANTMYKDKSNAEYKLRDSEMKFRLLAENSKDMIFKMSLPDGHYEYISPASLEIIGYTPKEIMDEPFHIRNTIHPDWSTWLDDKITSAILGYSEDTFEYQIINKSGHVVWINQKNNLIKDSNGKVIALVGRLSDDTERKSIEDQLRHKFRLDAIGQIAGGVAHDFNNILGGIMNASQVLSSPKRKMDDKSILMVDLIRKSAKRASELTLKLSAFSRKRSFTLNLIDLHNLLDETATVLRESIADEIELLVNKTAHNSIVLADGTELQSAILNLVINGSHAIDGKGKILLETKNIELDTKYCNSLPFEISPGPYLRLEIKDSGCGISKDNLDKIFEPFFSTKKKGEGTGLGLATVYGAVVNHHGAIEINSELSVGTSFFILIPSSKEKIETKTKRTLLEEGKGNILVVDDEEIIRISSKNMLEDMGYGVFTAENGKVAVDIYNEKNHEIDIVLMDMLMPVMNGHQAFFKLKEINKDCKIIIASGYTKNEDVDELTKSGLSGFLRKPFTDVELNKLLVKVLQK